MIRESELILNPDQSIYHLHLRPEHLADTIITVGDPNRVAAVSQHFDEIGRPQKVGADFRLLSYHSGDVKRLSKQERLPLLSL